MKKAGKALVMWGGWDGHTPRETAAILASALEGKGFEVTLSDTLAPLADKKLMKKISLVVPMWTMGEMAKEEWEGLDAAVRAGTGIAGVHGGMGDAFRKNLTYQWMTGGQFVGHPHVGDYTVKLTDVSSPITKGMKKSFKYNSEQYYMIVDPGIKVLADTVYNWDGKKIKMPVVWTKTWGKGKVFYSALGHIAEEFEKYPEVLEMTARGMAWAAGK
ncbi:MAG: ThuA domain-containing protein [Planctomycetes bacterium]|nr:ThuA domain-containing protein [Planctomycetota bacterium]